MESSVGIINLNSLREQMHLLDFTKKTKQRFHLINGCVLSDIRHLNNPCAGLLRSCCHVSAKKMKQDSTLRQAPLHTHVPEE